MSLIVVFRVLNFSLGVRMSLSVEGAGHMPRRCAATSTNYCRVKSCCSSIIHPPPHNRDSSKFFLLAYHAVNNCIRLTERLDNAAYQQFLMT